MKWPLKSEKIEQIIYDLERYKLAFSLTLNTDQAAFAIATDAGLTQLRQDFGAACVDDVYEAALTMAINTAFVQLREDFAAGRIDDRQIWEEKARRDIAAWLSTTDPSVNHVDQRRMHQPTTGNRFIRGQEFEKWCTSSRA